ncbi:hypothetical protein G7064_06125 [Hymenobacter sp. HDW8]|nr:hypothetical protein G7064_06125 [Hymenobacter sp. HDW8]
MITPVLIIFIGFLIFFGHYLAEMFDRTRIPDVVGLLLVGILLGPVFHLIDPASFGQAGRVFTNIVLVFILFESGLEVRFEQLKLALRGTAALTTLNFIVTTMLVAAMAQMFAGLDFLSSVILGSILGAHPPQLLPPWLVKWIYRSKPPPPWLWNRPSATCTP